MSRKIAIIFLFLVALSVLLTSCSGGAQSTVSTTTGAPAPLDIEPMGDADGDGDADEDDYTLFSAYLAREATEMHYEFCDINGDFRVDGSDAELLRAYLDGERIEILGGVFSREYADVTNELEDLGINNKLFWNDSKEEYIISRNPYDMITSGGVVMVSGGNYQDNTGPVNINGYKRSRMGPINMGSLQTEQVNRFYDCGEYIVALAIDSRYWQCGDVYLKPSSTNKWVSQSQVLVDNIHCYDMIYFDGIYFFCGSNDVYKNIEGERIELSKSSIYAVEGSLSDKMTKNDFRELEVINKHGEVIDFESVLTYQVINGQKYYYTMGVPRFYEFFEFGGRLYAFYYNQYSERYPDEYDFNGLYVYDPEEKRFVYDESLNCDPLYKIFSGSAQDLEKIQHDFAWGDRYYFINAGLYSTGDFLDYREDKLAGYEDYITRDVIFRGDKAYVLAGKASEDGGFINVVLETADFESFRAILSFESILFARSFEFCNGEFYFGLGYSSGSGLDAESIKNCGQIYRYSYYD